MPAALSQTKVPHSLAPQRAPPAAGGDKACRGGAPGGPCAAPAQALGNLTVQRALRLGGIRSEAEPEAERHAPIQRQCAACAAAENTAELIGDAAAVQRAPRTGGAASHPHAPAGDADAGRSSTGQALPQRARSFFEPRFGRDFSDVRIHADDSAARSARALSARAYTSGSDIVFDRGEYAPESASGRKLLAHELTHVVQQRAGVQLKDNIGQAADVYERQADEAANAIADGRSAVTLLAVVPGSAGRGASRSLTSTHRSQVVQRDPAVDHSSETKDKFATRVRERAATRLTQNIAVLGQWSDYVQKMEGFQLKAQLLTQVATSFATTAAPTPSGRARFEDWAGTYNASLRDWRGSELDVESTYRERTGNFMGYLTGMSVTGYNTSPSVADNLQVLAGDRSAESLSGPTHVGVDPRYAEYAGPIRRFQSGESGGCQTCHDINLAWQRTAELWGDPLPKGDPLGRKFADFPVMGWNSPLLASGTGDRAGALGAFTDANAPASPAAAAPSPSTVLMPAADPAPSNPFVPDTKLPEGVVVPPARTNLCGELPPAEDSQRVPSLAAWGPSSAIVASVIERIDSVLTPLGPRGYRVLPRQHFDSLYALSPENMQGVRDGIVTRIDERKQQYAGLRTDIQGGGVPYEELCPIVDELLPGTNPMVRWQAMRDVQSWQRRERLLQVLELTLLALSVIFPPSMIVTIPAGMALGLARASLGVDQRRQARQWQQGTGAGLYSLSQEAEAPGLADRGRSNIIWGMIGFGLSAFGSVRLVNQISEARASARLLHELEHGTVVITSPLYPSQVLKAQNGKLMLIDTETDMILGFGSIKNGQVSWMPMRMPFPSGSGTSGATSGAMGLVRMPSGPAALTPFGSTPAMRGFPLAAGGPLATRPGQLFYGGGSGLGSGTFNPNVYNPCGRGDNCGFTSLAHALRYQQPGKFRDADALYAEQLERLGLTASSGLSRQLVFPRANYDDLPVRPGYEPLFSGGGNRLSDYSMSTVAKDTGLLTTTQPSLLTDWRTAFGPHASVADAVAARQEVLAQANPRGLAPDDVVVEKYIRNLQQLLPGRYIIGSHGSAHYMTMEIMPNGTIIGFDPQNLRQYQGLGEILNRMPGIDLALRISPPTAPVTGP